MTLICDVCGNEFNPLSNFCILITSMMGSGILISYFTQSRITQLIGIIFGMFFGLYYIYTNNKTHIKHTILDGIKWR